MATYKETGRKTVPIKEIMIGERIRTELGDLDLLALSISLHNLLDPIIVHQVEEHRYELVDGFRRLQAHLQLGKKEIDCRLFSTLDEETKQMLELELCLRRKSLSFIEEAKAVKSIVDSKRRKSILGTIGRFSGVVKNKEMAAEIGMSESVFSVNLKIADALENNPELGRLRTKKDVLNAISRGTYKCIDQGAAFKVFEESFLVEDPINMFSNMPHKIVDLCLLHPTKVDRELFLAAEEKLKMGGSMIVFTCMADIRKWGRLFEEKNLYFQETPYIWHVKKEDTYMPFLWAGKAREMPLRAMPMHLSYQRSPAALSLKGKPYNLLSLLIKSNTEPLGFVVSTHCEDVETVRACIEQKRNVRGCCQDKILHDRLIMTLKQGKK